jgi:hypothetical protein
LSAAGLLILSMLWCVTAAQAAPAEIRTVTPGAAPPAGWGRAKPSDPPSFRIDPQPNSPWTRTGWGFFVTADGRSMDPWGRGEWRRDADAAPGRTEGGFGWRQGGVSAAIGYSVLDDAPNFALPIRARPQGLAGFTISLRGR